MSTSNKARRGNITRGTTSRAARAAAFSRADRRADSTRARARAYAAAAITSGDAS